jgi:hypothetical protein
MIFFYPDKIVIIYKLSFAAPPSHFPDERALLPDPSRAFPFGWGFHFLPWAAGPGEDAATTGPPAAISAVTSRRR